jgi:hypothetical protein
MAAVLKTSNGPSLPCSISRRQHCSFDCRFQAIGFFEPRRDAAVARRASIAEGIEFE